ncbi:6-phosphogluconate dehydrogenase C-terminal domain-like protein [Athelia psychrophila]|uniref:6-phosphogluconate dehydrogenase C-terminal domain-like protein n=1 Tax=Athelia psychrophila TaxID=1759441 RepID=A0A166HAH7_9AGAM|nr:6-phosphogluconate dehydrogenase C-terminal domain-like protein [Fibularhizoctonia sp. CBS 109695]
MTSSTPPGPGPCIAIVSAGTMGAAVASALTSRGCTVLTHLTGRSADTRQRAAEAGMQDGGSLKEIAQRARWVLSIMPPSSAEKFATDFLAALHDTDAETTGTQPSVVFVNCNTVNPETIKRIAGHFAGTGVPFIDATILGISPEGGYSPKFYASAGHADRDVLLEFAGLARWGLPVVPLVEEGAGVGDASALKMAYSGILKGTIGLHTTMILAAHAASPATATALMEELHASQPAILTGLSKSIPIMFPKAYRWVREMEEMAGFVEGEEREIYRGMEKLYARIAESVEQDGEDVRVLRKFIEDAQKASDSGSGLVEI